MSWPLLRAVFLLELTSVAVLSPRADAAEPDDPRTQWQFGERTTARLPGEVETPDPEPSAEGVYGRLDGDVTLALGAGAEFGEASAGVVRISGHYYWMAGIYATYRDALTSTPEPADARRALSLGIDLRPAFLPRWVRDYQQGPALLDLTLDSISLGLGVYWAEPSGAGFGDERGYEASLGFGIPLFARASGLWLEGRGLLRWDESAQPAPAIVAMLGFHQVILTPFARDSAEIGVAH